MQRMSSIDRDLLAGRRLTRPRPNTWSVIQRIRGGTDRVLIPMHLSSWFLGDDRVNVIHHTALRNGVIAVAEGLTGARHADDARPGVGDAYSAATLMIEVFTWIGVHLPIHAIDQSCVGIPLELPRPGTLAFFESGETIEDEDRVIGHVGLITLEGELVHASAERGKVVKEPMTPPTMVVDVIPNTACLLVELPTNPRGLRTALDVARWLQR